MVRKDTLPSFALLILEAISKKSFVPISVLGPRFNSLTYLSMRVEDPVTSRGGLKLGPALTLSQNPIFETAYKVKPEH